MGEVSQQMFLGTDQVFGFYNDKWVGINSYSEQAPLGFSVRNDPYSASVVIAMPGTLATNLGMTNYYDDISSQIRGTGNNVSIVPSGSGQIWASGSVVNSGSINFATNSGYETSVYTSGSQNAGYLPSGVLNLGTSNFVIEYWINYSTPFTAPPYNKGISSPGNDPNYFDFAGWFPRYRFGYNTNFLFFNQSQDQNVWYHVAYVRSGVNVYLYINGVRHASTYNIGTTSLNASAYHLMGVVDGNGFNGAGSRFNDLRITVGTDRGYTGSTITVPESIIYK